MKVAILVMLCVPGNAQLLPPKNYNFENNSEQMVELCENRCRTDEPGMALIIMHAESTLVNFSCGVEDLETRKPITGNTIFHTASVAKTFTSAAILKLFEDKKLKLSDRLAEYFPDVPQCTKDIRIIQLLNHTSGLPDYYGAYGDDVRRLSNADVLTFINGIDSLNFVPSTDYEYSNTAYVLLSLIVEKVTGTTFAEFLQEQFLSPLKLNSTTVHDLNATELGARAVGYFSTDSGFVRDDYSDITVTGPGGMFTTAEDLIRWLGALRTGKVLKPKTLSLAVQPPITLSGQRSYMAMGWFDETFGPKTKEVEGIVSYAAVGEFRGFRALIQVFPEYDIWFVMLSNTGDFPIGAREIAATYLKSAE